MFDFTDWSPQSLLIMMLIFVFNEETGNLIRFWWVLTAVSLTPLSLYLPTAVLLSNVTPLMTRNWSFESEVDLWGGLRAITQQHQVRFEVLTAVTLKSIVICDVMPYLLVDMYQRFRRTFCLHLHSRRVSHHEEDGTKREDQYRGFLILEYGDGRFLRNVCNDQLVYKMSHPRAQ